MKIKINREALAESGIPDYMQHHVAAYMETGRPVGDFLSAVINNDLNRAVAHADANNIRALPEYVRFFFNHCPVGSWGHENATSEWREKIREYEEMEGDDIELL